MHVCFISGEIFAFGKYGGFGRATRVIGAGLVRRGLKVSAVVPQRGSQKAVEELDGISVYSFPRKKPWMAAALYKQINADIYHSEEPSFGTWLAQRKMCRSKHIVTCRDPRDAEDWAIECQHPTISRFATHLTRIYEYGPLVSRAVRNADFVGCAAHVVGPKAQRVYGLDSLPVFLPTPVPVPATVTKSTRPVVCFLSRWDARKRPELFFELAPMFPDVQFIAAGLAHDADRDKALRHRYGQIENLEMRPLLNQFQGSEFTDLLSKSWVFANTALREGLPNSFIEAAAHGCAILSGVDPDGFCSRFGYHVKNDDFALGLRTLLEGRSWKSLGESGRAYVKETFEADKALDQHLDLYKQLLN
ncbi:MAG: glycosyltransferase family 4 protein [Kiritimatiellae bacterium]|nr:glycosyltransferase family 4 protein [Kiritimatiellia bacterium]